MKILGYEIRRAKQETPSSYQINQSTPQGHLTSVFSNYIFRKVSGDFYEQLREGIPIIDSAIRRLISLNGTVKLIGDNMQIVKVLEDFCLNVPVNDTQKGIHAFLENASNETFEQGFSLSEFVTTTDMKDIAGIRVADSKNIIYRRNKEGVAEPWYRHPDGLVRYDSTPTALMERIINASYGATLNINGVNETKLNPANKIYFSINNENTNPYGVSIMRSMEFVSMILATLQNSIMSVAERFGDPMYHLHYKAGRVSSDLEARRAKLEEDFKVVVNAKRAGKSGDIVTAGGADTDVNIKVIGHEGQIMNYDAPLRHVLEQIVSKTNLPAWMLGIYWSTTERMATLEVESALQDAKIRQLAMLPEFIRLFSVYLKIRGYKWDSITTSLDAPGDWGIIFETPNIRDEVARAQARFLNAQADQMSAQAGTTNTQTTVNVGAASAAIAHLKFLKKEIFRAIQWLELDALETEYENKLKADWEKLRLRTFEILKLKSTKGFSYTQNEIDEIFRAIEGILGEYSIKEDTSIIRWAYGEAYSLGLLQAAYLIGEGVPLLDIIKNKEIYDEMCKVGFKLVKDNITLEFLEKIIPVMESQMLAGINPLNVASKLEKLFADKNSDWERLARTEMTRAAEQAKLDEWKEWKIKKVQYAPAPDACPICMTLKGVYEINKCPVPAQDTHPRCRCSIRPVVED